MLVLAALTLVTIDARSQGSGTLNHIRSGFSDAFSPIERATHAALRPIGDFLTGAADYGSLKQENQNLRRQLAQAQTQEAQAAAQQQEAQQVLKNAGLTIPGSIPALAAEIIDVGPSNFDNSVTIDKGTADGVAAGQPVVAAGALVGSVTSAARHVATIRLITDPSFVVGVSLDGGNTGYAQGTGRTLPLRVTPIPGQAGSPPKETVGTVISTSGLTYEKFPKGLPIGKISKVSQPPGQAEPDIELAPLVNPTSLSFLEVLLWFPPAAGP